MNNDFDSEIGEDLVQGLAIGHIRSHKSIFRGTNYTSWSLQGSPADSEAIDP